MPEFEGVYEISDERDPLANFSPFDVALIGRSSVPTSEHAYSMSKFLPLHPEIAEMIEATSSPYEAKRITQKYKYEIRADWKDIRCKRMAVITRKRLRQNPELQEILLSTDKRQIIEDANKYAKKNPNQEEIAEYRRWGIYTDKNDVTEGENWIGEILMNFRTKLLETGKI